MSRKFSRRDFLRASIASAGSAIVVGCGNKDVSKSSKYRITGEWVNDVHSQLNRTHVAGVARPRALEELTRIIDMTHRRRESLSLCGGRHAGGGQQFRTGRQLLDLTRLNRILAFDPAAGTITVEAGIRWPAIFTFLHSQNSPRWAVHQKQGGADELSLGGAIASNIHGRCLASRPIVQDVVSLQVITPTGELLTCDRLRNTDRFAHVIGGYGLFGVVYSVTLGLTERRKLVRRVRWIRADEAVATLEVQRDAGAWHGDFQFAVDEGQPDFCAAGLCSWYEPVPDDRPINAMSREEAAERFTQLVTLAHQDKGKALALYREQVLNTDGKAVDWSDSWQHGDYVAGYHRGIDALRGESAPGSEILTELYVPRESLAKFLTQAGAILRAGNANLIYGTVRLIERDDETVLAWAKRDYACVIFNLHTQRTPAEIERNGSVFRQLLDAAIGLDGSYYLTYHRFAQPDQTARCYPRFAEFLSAKRRYDPHETFDSDWYQHYRKQFEDSGLTNHRK